MNFNIHGTVKTDIHIKDDDDDDDDKITSKNLTLYVVDQEEDLSTIAKLIVDTFGADAITLSGTLSSFEKAFLHPGVSAWNAYAAAVAYVEVLNGLRQRIMIPATTITNIPNRTGRILISPNVSSSTAISDDIVTTSSIILALGRIDPNHSLMDMDDIVATVELRLQPTDAKIPFSQPWIDLLERNIANCIDISTTSARDISLQPYLSNLFVSPQARRRNIGKAMVCVTYIVWKRRIIFFLDNLLITNESNFFFVIFLLHG